MSKFAVKLLFLVLTLAAALPAAALEKTSLSPTLASKDAGKRIALVIGNSNYKDSPLANPANDARLMAQTLTDLGFEVIRVLDADQKAMKRAVRDFGAKVERAGKDTVGLFYYAGHGVQVKGENFLIPVDASISREADVTIEAVNAGSVLEQMAFAKNQLNVVILDACRNNPFKRSFRSSTSGLARMDAPTGSIVAYSTAPGRVASDGDGRNGPYTAALVRAMRRPGLKVEDMFKQTRRRVMADTDQAQVPWESSSLVGDFYFSGGARNAAPQPAIALLPAPVSGETLKRAQTPTQMPGQKPAQKPTRKTRAGQAFQDCENCPEMMAVPGGAFTMGSTPREKGYQRTESPMRRVQVKGFAMGRHEVTRGQFARFVKETGYSASGGCWYWSLIWHFDKNRNWKNPGYQQTDDHPAVCLNWEDARAYTLWLSQKTGKKYRLPSEAEWEYAARAGTNTPQHWGKDSKGACAYENVYDRAGARSHRYPWASHGCDDGYAASSPVGKFKPNRFGLYDMLGNSPEWVADCWRDNYRNAPVDGRPYTNNDCKQRSIRGGTWANWPSFNRAAHRHFDEPSDRNTIYGFRVARDLN